MAVRRIVEIRVVSFDLDDTLWAVRPIIIRAEQTLGAWLAEEVPAMSLGIPEMRSLREEVVADNPELAHQLTRLRQTVLERAMILSGVETASAEELASAAMEVFLHARNQIEFFEGALEAIESLAQTFTLGALTNGNADIRRMGLDTYFDFSFSAEEVGAPKPAPDLFHRALSHTETNPHEMVYVGDDPILDVDAANRLGLRTVWINTRNKPRGETRADATISHVADLPEAIRTIADS